MWASFLVGFRAFLDWCKTPMGRFIILLTLFVVYSCSLYSCGHHNGVKKERAKYEAAAEQARKAEKAGKKITTEIRKDTQVKTQAVRKEIVYLTKEVPKYVTVQADANCPVTAGFVRLHDAATGQVPGPAGGLDETAPGFVQFDPDARSAVQLSDVAATDVHNLGVARELELEVKAWREWYPRVREAYGATPPRRVP